jgi:hypothetical protein
MKPAGGHELQRDRLLRGDVLRLVSAFSSAADHADGKATLAGDHAVAIEVSFRFHKRMRVAVKILWLNEPKRSPGAKA